MAQGTQAPRALGPPNQSSAAVLAQMVQLSGMSGVQVVLQAKGGGGGGGGRARGAWQRRWVAGGLGRIGVKLSGDLQGAAKAQLREHARRCEQDGHVLL